ncbi:MAG: hypothetical protein J6N50_02620 [Bacteroidales bacterium]|nr:hypothetical protein [Bacteroidales bacterium]
MTNEKASDISAAVMATINLATLSLSSEASGILSAFSPVIQNGIQRVLTTIGPSKLTDREKVRVGASVHWAIKAIEEHRNAGHSALQDQFDAKTIDALIESLFRAASEDSQEQKDQAYGSLLGNFAYQNKFDGGALFTLAKILKELTFDEMLLIASLYGRPAENYEPIYNKFLNNEDLVAGELVNHFLRLRDFGVTVRTYPYTTNHTVGSLKLSALGQGLYELAGLDKLAPEECSRLRDLLDIYIHE